MSIRNIGVDNVLEKNGYETVLYWLTTEELDAVCAQLQQLAGDIDFTVSSIESRRPEPRFHLRAIQKDLPRLIPHLTAVFERVRPIEQCIRREESQMASELKEMFRTKNFEWSREKKSPLWQLCILWAYSSIGVFLRKLNLSRRIDHWVDYFHPESTKRIDDLGISIIGYCYSGRLSDVSIWKGRFKAIIALDESQASLRKFELRFADAYKVTQERVIPESSPNIMIEHVADYRIVVQKAHETAASQVKQWAFQIIKQTTD